MIQRHSNPGFNPVYMPCVSVFRYLGKTKEPNDIILIKSICFKIYNYTWDLLGLRRVGPVLFVRNVFPLQAYPSSSIIYSQGLPALVLTYFPIQPKMR